MSMRSEEAPCTYCGAVLQVLMMQRVRTPDVDGYSCPECSKDKTTLAGNDAAP